MASNMISITIQEYQRLHDDSRLLDALREFGVDNWEGYSDAMSSIIKENE